MATDLKASSFFRKLQQIFTFWSDKGVPYLTLWQYLRVVYDMYTKVTTLERTALFHDKIIIVTIDCYCRL